jgi:predicted MFS family arabinose efflux permease
MTAALSAEHERRVVWVLAGIQFMHILDFVLMMPLGPQLMRLFTLTPRDFGILVSVYMFAAAVSGVAASAFADRFDRRTLLLGLLLGFVAALAATAAAPSFTTLILAHAGAGAFGGVLGMQVHAFLGDTIPDARRGRATGIIMSAFAVASVVGVPTGLVLAAAVSWRLPFALLALAALGLFVIAARVLPSIHAHLEAGRAGRIFATYGRVLAEANHRRAFLLVALTTFASFSIVPYIAPYMVRNVGIAESQIPLMYLVGGTATFFTSRWIGRQVDLHGKLRVFRWVALGSLLPILAMTHLPPVPLWAAVLVGVLFMSLVSGRLVPTMAMMNAAAAPGLRGSFLSLSGAVQQSSAGCAALTAGVIIGHGPGGELTRYGWIGMLGVVFTLAAVAWAARIRAVS